MLEVSNITKKFKDVTVIDNISFEVNKGDMLGFLGKNGAGKSTTFRMILGLLDPTLGKITYKNEPIDESNLNSIGFLPEERGLHTKLTVEKELLYMASLKGMSAKKSKERINYWLNKFEIQENKHKKIISLSKGNQQKVQLIVSLIHEPELLILDEPFSGLDPINVELLKNAIIELNQNGTTIIFSSHRLDHVEELCNKICIINNGNILLKGDLNDIKSNFSQKRIMIESAEDFSYLDTFENINLISRVNDKYFFDLKNVKVYKTVFEEIKKSNYITQFLIIEPSINDIFIQTINKDEE
ncbi:ATP-binding cassette domain-containing protein [Staphylococcus agnetis]|uniref:ABC transporter ATP-binding protein n=1 Tax=Staphylococcus agnetis TaxID=985762 RepID=UPI00208DF9C0|nr:ATP-binding cassette domain-containing protein [Staphylococcus agnetis]MCO4327810.1 ATP-binding cassette domain-containing protein [Staphylococcus agnetis]MCO4353495.1 ATP-binding cassette domain-containing protein [Staphylococcus agnetis]MCO4370185.1 ATP-binding cassette domain-containing protein [Staphylococcus agnetis]